MTETPSELILYRTEHGRTRIECRFEKETLWLTQAQMAEPQRAYSSSSVGSLLGRFISSIISKGCLFESFRPFEFIHPVEVGHEVANDT